MSPTRVQTIRKAAVLLASLDEQQGRQLTDGLSSNDADLLRQAVADLGPIDPQERQEISQELRLGTSHQTSSWRENGSLEEGVEFDWSAATLELDGGQDPDRAGSADRPASAPHDPGRSLPVGRPFSLWGSHDTHVMAEKLLHEPPQIIAVVMSKLMADQAADLLGEMPLALQAEVLERLHQLHPADQQSLEVVEDHLAGWIESHRQQQQRLSQGNEKVRQILARTSNSQRKKILNRLGSLNRTWAQELEEVAVNTPPSSSKREIQPEPGAAEPSEHTNQQGPEQTTLLTRPKTDHNFEPTRPAEPTQALGTTSRSCEPLESPSMAPGIATAHATSTETRGAAENLACGMEMLDQVSDAMLLEALRKAEPQIAMLALAGAPPRLLDRILGQLPRRQAKLFRRQLHSLQPTRIRDLLDAQQQFAQMAMGVAKCDV